MKLLCFDIETYKEHFCWVGRLYDSDTKQEIEKVTVTDKNGQVDRQHMAVIEHYFENCDYIISFNGKNFETTPWRQPARG